MTSFVTTHVLDAASGSPAVGVLVLLETKHEGRWTHVADGRTDADGRIADLGPDHLASGDYRLTFDVGTYFADRGVETFYPEVTVTCRLDAAQRHYHVPILLSPFAYSTYRGS